MKFEHLVEINDPLNPLIDPLTQDQLWRGLVLRANEPESFVLALDECRIIERTENGLRRELRFGNVTVRDSVRFEAPWRVRYLTEAQQDLPAATLTMSIEAPEPGQLYVRFEYDNGTPEPRTNMDTVYEKFRRNAWQEADIDTIGRIRQLAEEGLLG